MLAAAAIVIAAVLDRSFGEFCDGYKVGAEAVDAIAGWSGELIAQIRSPPRVGEKTLQDGVQSRLPRAQSVWRTLYAHLDLLAA